MPAASNATTLKSAREKLGLTSGNVEISRRMGHSLLTRLNAAGIRTLDPLHEMQQSSDELFWEADYHINHTGHDLLARIVVSYLKPVLAGMRQFEQRTPPNKDMRSDK
ncbi:MAG: hypothetical protein HY848_19395 [Betaproteobacteria bacterium]|nr:hypothetical protein [Betaproteobacteria bacterium]